MWITNETIVSVQDSMTTPQSKNNRGRPNPSLPNLYLPTQNLKKDTNDVCIVANQSQRAKTKDKRSTQYCQPLKTILNILSH